MTFEAKILANTLYVKGIVSRYRVTPVYGLILGGSVVKCIVKRKNVHVSCDVFLSPVLSDYVVFCFFKICAAGRRSATFSSR